MNTMNFEIGRTYNAIYKSRELRSFDMTFTVLEVGQFAVKANILFCNDKKPIGFLEASEDLYTSAFKYYDFKDVTNFPDEWIKRVRIATLSEIIEAVGIDVIKIRFTNKIPLSWNVNEFQGTGKTIYYAAFSAFALEEDWKAKEHFGNDGLILACDSLDEFKAQITSIIPNANFILEGEYRKY